MKPTRRFDHRATTRLCGASMTINEFTQGWPEVSNAFAVLVLMALVDISNRIDRVMELRK